jgi:hypothetical protein
VVIHIINGAAMAVMIDDDPSHRTTGPARSASNSGDRRDLVPNVWLKS